MIHRMFIATFLIVFWMIAAAAPGIPLHWQDSHWSQRSAYAQITPVESGDSIEQVNRLINDGNYAEAESRARELLERAEKGRASDSTQVATVLDALVKSLRLGGKASKAETRALAERALVLKERLFGSNHLETATSVSNLAKVLSGVGDEAAALRLEERALAIREKVLGPDNLVVAASLRSVASLLSSAGQYQSALPLYEKEIEIKRREFGKDNRDVLYLTSLLADKYRLAGDYSNSRRLIIEVLEAQERTLGSNDLDVATSLNIYSLLLRWTGEYAEACRVLNRALAIRVEKLGPHHERVAHCLNNLALALHSLGDYSAACEKYEQTLTIIRKQLGETHRDYGACLTNLAITRIAMGDFAGANELNERGLIIREAALGAEHPDVAVTLTSLGVGLMSIGDYESARPHLERAVRIREKVLGPDHTDLSTSLSNLASLLDRSGELPAALELDRRVVDIRRRAWGEDHPDVALALGNLGRRLSKADNRTESIAALRHMVEIQSKVFQADHPDVAMGLEWLASVLGEVGLHSEAMGHLERALAIVATSLGSENKRAADIHASLSMTYLSLGYHGPALDHALAAESIGRSHLRLTFRGLSESQAQRYAAVRATGLPVALALATGATDTGGVGRIWDTQIRSRALLLDESTRRHRMIHTADDPVVDSLLTVFTGLRARQANLSVRGPGNMEPDIYRRLLEETAADAQSTERELAVRSAAFSEGLARDMIGLDDVLRAVPLQCGLIAFSKFQKPEMLSIVAAGMEDSLGRDTAVQVEEIKPLSEAGKSAWHYIALVWNPPPRNSGDITDRSPGAAIQVVSLGCASGIDSLVTDWRKLAEKPEEHEESDHRVVGEALRRRIWDPIAPYVVDCKQVFVVPDGDLHLVNFAALPVGEREYLVEQNVMVHYLSAERDLVGSDQLNLPATASAGALVSTERAATGAGLLVVGDPDYDRAETSFPHADIAVVTTARRGAHSRCDEFASILFPRLPATAKEAKSIAARWSKQKLAADRKGIVSLTGVSATESEIKRACSGKRVVHLATHGFFLGDGCPSAVTSTTRGLGRPVRDDEPPPLPKGENPLLLSGLAVASANLRSEAPPDGEDGILTAEEVASLDLSGVEWAVLSACGTGLGEARTGEGVFGLRRAFTTAGARTLIMSLWSVEDESAAEWMERLYKARLDEGRTTVESVREASLGMLRERRTKGQSTHPAYWGAFIAAGDWR